MQLSQIPSRGIVGENVLPHQKRFLQKVFPIESGIVRNWECAFFIHVSPFKAWRPYYIMNFSLWAEDQLF